MARIKIDLPAAFTFQTNIPVRITDLNYGGHVGNDTILSILHESRMQYLKSLNYTELAFEGVGLIMADVGIEFKAEVFYGDTITASLVASEISKISFDLYYKLEKTEGDKTVLVAAAKTRMICFNYTTRKVTAIPETAKNKLSAG
ncbi:MAG: acyl-CoA thioesterase [Chitinophagaceae bacterium]|nr:MAG: acyl-CoA thioesterase [Chitinophagaceae bacterium]